MITIQTKKKKSRHQNFFPQKYEKKNVWCFAFFFSFFFFARKNFFDFTKKNRSVKKFVLILFFAFCLCILKEPRCNTFCNQVWQQGVFLYTQRQLDPSFVHPTCVKWFTQKKTTKWFFVFFLMDPQKCVLWYLILQKNKIKRT